MIKNYFTTAWRSLLKNRGTTIINITGLAVGMTAAVLILLWVQNEIHFDNFQPAADRIYRLTTSIPVNDGAWETTPLLLADAAKKNVPEIETISRLFADNQPVFRMGGNLVYEKKCAYVDDDWFSLFHFDFIEGNAASFANNPNSIILTESEAKKYFGNKPLFGTVIHVDSMDFQVKGVVKDAPSNSSFQYKAFLPMAALLANPEIRINDENWDNYNYLTFVKLKAGYSTAATSKKLAAIFPGNEKGAIQISMVGLKDMHFEKGMQPSSFVHGNLNTVYIFSILAFLLLLVACINYVNLTTAKATLRAKEVGIRKISGAKPIHLFYQFIAESLLVSVVSVLCTLLIVRLCLPVFNSFTGKDFSLSLASPGLWMIIGSTMFVAFVLNSIYPAILLSSFKPLNVFKGITILKVKDSYFRKGLVVVQFTIAVMLIASAIIIWQQMKFTQQSNPGYNRSQVLAFALPPGFGGTNKAQLIQTMRQQLLAQKSIQEVTIANQPVVNIGSYSTGSADWVGRDTTFNPKVAQLATDGNFLNTMQLTMKEGRWLQDGEADKNNVVLNETAVKEFNLQQPVVGQSFSFKGRTGQVTGVVKNFNYKSTHEKMGPLVAFNNPEWFRIFMVRVSPGNVGSAVTAVENVWKKFAPDNPIEYSFLDDSFNELYKEDQQTSFLILVFAIIAVVISSMGLFGLVTFTAGQRIKEIGIRKVLGATVTNITSLLSKDFVQLVCIAIIIATPLAYWAMQRWIQIFAYRIDIVWWMFALAGLLALLIAVITTGFQSVKAALANPVKSLKSE
jgi:putative ABC transport system permease protein